MPSPFPGMNPYLEQPGIWEEVHTRLIVAIADALGPQVRPRYRVGVEQRTYLAVMWPDPVELVGKPDVVISGPQSASPLPPVHTAATGVTPQVAEIPMPEEVTERFLQIKDVASGDVVTVIELLSPTNKVSQDGRAQYERKRLNILQSATHLVEIDLLRAGRPFPFRLRGADNRSDYRIMISRAPDRPRADIFLFSIRDVIPDISIPLRSNEPEPALRLNDLLQAVYERAGYDLTLDYSQTPPPPKPHDSDIDWLRHLLKQGEG